MIIRDYYCCECGNNKFDIISESISDVNKYIYCEICNKNVLHHACCNGGLGKRFRENDFPTDIRRYRGHVNHSVEAYDDEACTKPSKNKRGQITHAASKFSDEAKAERMDKIYHNTDRERGYANPFCDLKRKAAN